MIGIDLFKDMEPWERLTFRVSMCVHLGEYPEDHGLTLEEVDYVCYWIYDNWDQCHTFSNEGDYLFPNGFGEVFRAKGVDSSKQKKHPKTF